MRNHYAPLAISLLALLTTNVSATVRYVDLNCTNPTPPYTNWTTAAVTIQQAVDAASPDDEIVVTNGIYATGGKAVGTEALVNRVAVDKPLTVRSVNGPQFTVIRGYQVPGTTNGDAAVRGAYLTNGASLFGFTLTNGAVRTTGISFGETSGGGARCESGGVVSNCVLTGNAGYYNGGGAYGGTLNNCTLRGNSCSGGAGAHSCTLNNCTLTYNSASDTGGGAKSCTLNNCTLTYNSASYAGGGAHGGTLNNCTLTNNSSAWAGGGAYGAALNNCALSGNSAEEGGGTEWGTLNNCTLTGNSATNIGGAHGGGGAYGSTLNNCIVYYNSAPNNANYGGVGVSLNYCCTTPLPTNGTGNITNAPLFVNYAGGNLRLQTNSPCINAGNNTYVVGTTDLDGRPRIVGGTVDMGAYEFQAPGMGEFIGWLQQCCLATDGSADYTDPDGDRMNNWREWRCDTIPTNALSVLQMQAPTGNLSGVMVTWQSVANRTYFLDRSADFALQPPFLTLASNIVGLAGTTSYTDTNAVGLGPFFYRVGVQ